MKLVCFFYSLLEGWKCGNEIRELAFSLPLMTGEMVSLLHVALQKQAIQKKNELQLS